MALVKCNECGKQISSNANACPACGNPIGGVSSAVSGDAFERRIEEYKNNGYTIKKRDNNAVHMLCDRKHQIGNKKFFMILGLIIISNVILGILIFYNISMVLAAIIPCILLFTSCMTLIKSYTDWNTATITLLKNGKIEETGNVLKR